MELKLKNNISEINNIFRIIYVYLYLVKLQLITKSNELFYDPKKYEEIKNNFILIQIILHQ